MIKIGVGLVLAILVILFIQEQGNPGLLEEFAETAGETVTKFINWLGGKVEESDVEIPVP